MNDSAVAALVGGLAGLVSLFVSPRQSWLRRVTLISGILMTVASLAGIQRPLPFLIGLALMWLVDRFVHPLCPACADDHNHAECSTRLHGLGIPLLTAFGIHALADGLSGGEPGVLLHKIPEGLAMALLFRAAFPKVWQAVAATAGVQSFTALGGVIQVPLNSEVMGAFGKGTLFFLGVHSMHSLHWRAWVAQGTKYFQLGPSVWPPSCWRQASRPLSKPELTGGMTRETKS